MLKPMLKRALNRFGIIFVLFFICLIFAVWTKGLFLKPDNLINVLRQISINAVIATGMTCVILTGGIDLSVGSIVALVGVFSAQIMSALSGWGAGDWLSISGGCAGGILLGALTGWLNGFTITRFKVPPFISTLAMMTAASGIAFIICNGRPVWNLPVSFNYIGRGYVLESLLGPWLPVPVIIMVLVMGLAHIMLTQTAIGRYVYAVGGNEEASRLSGIAVNRIKLLVYTLSGTAAALGGIVLTSRLASGQPNSGQSYELYAIAASVVGGTSLSGGEGSILGALSGALIIGVLSNGMNLAGVESYSQKVILGLIILGAVMLDQERKARS
jgi:ribose transport system permease protein